MSESPLLASESDVRVETVASVPTEHVPCPPELYPAHSSSVVREGDHWRCLICQPKETA
jgi:hypothetical protein